MIWHFRLGGPHLEDSLALLQWLMHVPGAASRPCKKLPSAPLHGARKPVPHRRYMLSSGSSSPEKGVRPLTSGLSSPATTPSAPGRCLCARRPVPPRSPSALAALLPSLLAALLLASALYLLSNPQVPTPPLQARQRQAAGNACPEATAATAGQVRKGSVRQGKRLGAGASAHCRSACLAALPPQGNPSLSQSVDRVVTSRYHRAQTLH